jgi:hypothetical protein
MGSIGSRRAHGEKNKVNPWSATNLIVHNLSEGVWIFKRTVPKRQARRLYQNSAKTLRIRAVGVSFEPKADSPICWKRS